MQINTKLSVESRTKDLFAIVERFQKFEFHFFFVKMNIYNLHRNNSSTISVEEGKIIISGENRKICRFDVIIIVKGSSINGMTISTKERRKGNL
jgi:hypothetical protein